MQISCGDLDFMRLVSSQPDGILRVSNASKQFGEGVIYERIDRLSRSNLLAFYHMPEFGMNSHVILTTLGQDALAAEEKRVADEIAQRAERDAKEKADREAKEKSDRRTARRSWTQFIVNVIVQLLVGIVGVIIGAIIQARADIASWFLKLLGL